jgi:hypothetical protein
MAGYPIVRSVDFDKPQGTLQARKKLRGEQQEHSHAVFSGQQNDRPLFSAAPCRARWVVVAIYKAK